MFKLQAIERDFAILEDLREERVAKIYKERLKPFNLDDEEFFLRYRLDKIATRFLINLLNIDEPKSNRGMPVPISLQVLSVLRFLGRNAHQMDVACLHGMSQPTVGRVIKNISKKLALLLPHFIRFPNNAELVEVKRRFHQLAGFPAVIGVIGRSHVRIWCPTKISPHKMANHSINRKGSYSLTVQIVCDAECKITDIAVTRGSKHDTGVWMECQLKKKLETCKNEHNGMLLADEGYPLSQILLTPVRNPSTPKEERYNKSHIETRTKVESLNRQLESKFRSIFQRLRVDLDNAKNIILATAILHNVAKERNSEFLDACPAVETDLQISNFSDKSSQRSNRKNSKSAHQIAFINEHF